MKLTKYLNSNGFYAFEGHSQQLDEQIDIIKKIVLNNNDKIHNILEIGFNAGHSAELFLEYSSLSTKVISLDIGLHQYVHIGKNYIDNIYPYRHRLIIGNSKDTLVRFINENPELRFDLIFIDGSHQYDIVKSDFINCVKLMHNDTIIIMDDVVYKKDYEADYTIGPTKVWREMVSTNVVKELGQIDFKSGRGMVWGKFI